MDHKSSDFSYLIERILQSTSESDQIQAIHSLGWWYPKDAIPHLISFLEEPLSPTIIRIILETLIELFKNGISEEQQQIVSAQIHVQTYIHHSDWRIRVDILEIMKWLVNPEHIPFIIEAFQDRDPGVRRMAVNAITSFGKQIEKYIINALDDANDNVIDEAINSVRKLGITLPAFLRARLRVHPSLKIRVNYANCIMDLAKRFPKKYADEVFLYIADVLPYLQGNAIETLAIIKDPRLLDILAQKLESSDDQVIEKSLEAIEIIQAKDMVPEILKKLTDLRKSIRRAAVEAIGSFQDRLYLPDLFSLLYDNFEEVRTEVYLVLKRLPDSRAILPLLERLKTATIIDKRQIWEIFDQFSYYDLIIPFAREYRSNDHVDPYIITKLQEHISDISLIKKLVNLGISTLINLLNDEELWHTASEILIGWGFRALSVLESKKNTEQRMLDEKQNEEEIALALIVQNRIQDIIGKIEKQMEIRTGQGYTLLL